MSAERMPPVGSSILAKKLVQLTQVVIHHPVKTLVVSALVMLVALTLGYTHISYRTSRSALLGHKSDAQRRWSSYADEFGDNEDVVLVVQGENRDALVPVLDELAKEVGQHTELFQATLHGIDLTKLHGKGLYYLPLADLQAVDHFVEETEPIVRGGWALLTPGAMAMGMVARVQDLPPEKQVQGQSEVQERLIQLADSLLASICRADGYRSPWSDINIASMPLGEPNSNRLIAEDGRLGFILLKLADADRIRGLDILRQIVAQAQSRHSQVQVGLTGLPVIENDGMRCSQSSVSLATILALGGVIVVLVAGLGGLWHPLWGLVTLLTGIAWSLGYTALTVGHLNVFSSIFGVIFIGLGAHYGTYFIARYLQLRREGRATDEALLGTAESVGPAITLGAAATAIAFLMIRFTEFTGIAELGLIAGGGIIFCWLAAMTMLPALIHLFDSQNNSRAIPTPLAFSSSIEALMARPRLVLGLTVGLTLAVGLGIPKIRHDDHLLNLQFTGLESVELERKLTSEAKESEWYAVSMVATPQEVATRKEQFLHLPLVERVEEIATRIPADNQQKRAIIEHLHARLGKLPKSVPSIPVSTPAELGQMLGVAQGFMSVTPQAGVFQEKLEQIGEFLGHLSEKDYYARLSAYQQQMGDDLLERLRMLQTVDTSADPQLTDLPDALVSRFVGKHGKHLLKVYCRHGIGSADELEQFVLQVRGVDPDATGNLFQIYEASQQMKRSSRQATYWALAGVLPVVFLACGSLETGLLALLPLILSTLQMFGLMGLLKISWNPANMIALPIMLGVSVNNGIYIVRDFLSQRGRYRMSAATSTAVVLNTLMIMVSFAVLMLAARHEFQSLGRTLTLGMGCCLLSSLIALPVLLIWMTTKRELAANAPTIEAKPQAAAPKPRKQVVKTLPRGTGYGSQHRVDAAHPQTAAQAPAASRKVLREYLDMADKAE